MNAINSRYYGNAETFMLPQRDISCWQPDLLSARVAMLKALFLCSYTLFHMSRERRFVFLLYPAITEFRYYGH